jgi:hypothetical protein
MYYDDDFLIGEGRADKPIGYPPTNAFIKQALEKMYISIVGAIDVGDFETFLKESADLTYDEAKDKMIREYGTPTELSQARYKAKSAEAASKLELAEQETRAEQRTFEQEFTELDEIARKRLGENLDLSRRNTDLERELKRLKEEMAKAKAVPPAALPPGAPVPPVPAAPPAALPVHGSMYDEYLMRISEVITMHELDELASEIFDIIEREEYYKLTRSDTDELMKRLRETSERRAMKLAEMKIPELKPKIRKLPPMEGVEAPPAFFGVLPPQVMHRYLRPDIEKAAFAGEEFVRDHELERTIIRNNLLLFPPQWYVFPPSEKIRRYGWDLSSAFRHAVEALHKYSWEDLIKDYGIPEKYIEAWKKTAS